MAGILNSKERVIDFLITQQGKKQLSDGRMIVEYASFTDRHTFYQASGSEGTDLSDVADDASSRLFFEASHRHQDILVPEVDPGASMQSFRAGYFNVEGRKIASGTFFEGTGVGSTEISGTDGLSKIIPEFLKSLSTNFSDQRILQTKDQFSDTTGFSLGAHTASFVLTDDAADFGGSHQGEPLHGGVAQVNLDNVASIANSGFFTHLPNFKFLPPINVKDKSTDPDILLGEYPRYDGDLAHTPFGATTSRSQIMASLSLRQSLKFSFKESSISNNIISQVFEVGENMEKLSIIDFGQFAADDTGPDAHIFFVGRVKEDSQGTHTYMNLFTLVFE